MYGKLADLYDPIYSFKDYRRETALLVALARRHARSVGRDWLDVACGTGRHLEELARRYRCVGVDSSPEMLRIARRRLPRTRLVRGDVRRFRLRRRFDVVSCLFSSIGYLPDETGLREAFRNLAAHLKPGGLMIVEPWLPPGRFRPGHVGLVTYDAPELKIARMNDATIEGGRSVMRMHYLVGRRGEPVRHVVSVHRLSLFPRGRTLALLRDAGLTAWFDPDGLMPGRGLFLAVAPRAGSSSEARTPARRARQRAARRARP